MLLPPHHFLSINKDTFCNEKNKQLQMINSQGDENVTSMVVASVSFSEPLSEKKNVIDKAI